MRLLNLFPILCVLLLPAIHFAAEPDDTARHDSVYNAIDAAFHARFPGAKVIKVDRKEKEKREGDIFLLSWGYGGAKNEVYYTLTISDELNKKFDVVFNSHAELVATEKYKATFDALPPAVQTAIGQKASNAGSTDVLECRLERGVFKVSGKINGRKVNEEVNVGSIAPPTPVLLPADVRKPESTDEKIGEVVKIDAPPTRSGGKPEIAAAVDGPFRAMFPDATVAHVDHKELTNVTIHVFSIGGGDSKYEITFSDPLNKKVKAIYADTGHLMSASTFIVPFERLPREVQKAIEQVTAVTDPSVTLEVRVDHKALAQTEHEEYKVTGRVNGVKISLEVPFYGNH